MINLLKKKTHEIIKIIINIILNKLVKIFSYYFVNYKGKKIDYSIKILHEFILNKDVGLRNRSI